MIEKSYLISFDDRGQIIQNYPKIIIFSVCVLPSLTPTLAKKKQKKLKILRFVQYFNLIILATDRISRSFRVFSGQ